MNHKYEFVAVDFGKIKAWFSFYETRTFATVAIGGKLKWDARKVSQSKAMSIIAKAMRRGAVVKSEP